ncbi:MAG: hypothetical protein IJ936_06405 [Peptococcaceae bacterium]|nr:hypothetical protein [Peptococcaceae bacterium]
MRLPNCLSSSKIGVKEYIAAFCFTVFLAVILLAAAAFLPQESIREHILESEWIVSRDFENPSLFDNSAASKLDVATDAMMLNTSLMTNRRYLGAILTNPVYTYEGLNQWDDASKILANLAYEIPSDGVWYYARYWMGFRVVLRLALSFFTYAQIKRYLSFLFLTFFAGTVCSVSKHANSKIAFFFALSIILVRPHVMATSMQFTCCFFLAFAAMFLIPWLHRHGKWEGLFFMELGMITMYFDFYTVPLVTLGFPLMYLVILKREDFMQYSYRRLFRNMAAWFLGYGLMWIAKLSLTSFLTSVNAFRQGFKSLFTRVGIRKDAEVAEFYSVEAAFEGVKEAVFSDEQGMAVYLLCVGLILTVVLIKILRGHASFVHFRNAAPYLLFAAIPLVWFVITKQPIAIHYYFQYRSIALTHWAAGVFLYYFLPEKSGEQIYTI